MVEDGLFDLFPCDHIFGLHNMPSQPLGKIGLRDGAMMASSDTLHIEVNGVGGHGAVPEHTVDATLTVHYFAQHYPLPACRRYRRQHSGRTCPQHYQRQSIDETYRAHAG
ncbi:amidohydrolase [Enterobacter cloacae]|nr:amidohydrolase [Enterobacter cloacae]